MIKNTDFQYFYDVFAGAWWRIEKAIQKAKDMGLGILIGKPEIGCKRQGK